MGLKEKLPFHKIITLFSHRKFTGYHITRKFTLCQMAEIIYTLDINRINMQFIENSNYMMNHY